MNKHKLTGVWTWNDQLFIPVKRIANGSLGGCTVSSNFSVLSGSHDNSSLVKVKLHLKQYTEKHKRSSHCERSVFYIC